MEMTAGRKPKPTALKLLTGNPGGRKLNANEAKPDLAQPTPPDFLNDHAKVEWGRIVGTLFRTGLRRNWIKVSSPPIPDGRGGAKVMLSYPPDRRFSSL
jgi:hypothetical protein